MQEATPNKIQDRIRAITSKVDLYIAALLGMVLLASILPARGQFAAALDYVVDGLIALLFFLYGARLSWESVMQGIANWRLQLIVAISTFALFPVLGLLARPLIEPWLGTALYTGFLFLCLLPSTVQSSIAFTSIARGNVPAALCAASVSNIAGVIITPLLAGWLLSSKSGAEFNAQAIQATVMQLLVPFAIGQLLRRWIGGFMFRYRKVLGYVDRSSILMVVYTAFSEGVVTGIWHRLDLAKLAILAVVSGALLAVVLKVTTWTSRRMRFPVEDEIALVLCGSKKSLATGIPMANILFPASAVGLMVLPLMVFHQIQLMVCAVLARRYAARPVVEAEESHRAVR